MPRRKAKLYAKLDASLINQICAFIRAGGYPHVAAEAAGIPQEVFAEWMTIGSQTKAQGPRRELFLAVRQAQAQARLKAEMAVFQDDPAAWLKSGPGKDRPDCPGWTTPTRALPQANTTNQQINVLLDPNMQGVFASLLQILAPFPEARARVAEALAGDFKQPRLPPPPPLPPLPTGEVEVIPPEG
jgi:hypothetical protein